jgi:hypothetical protein
MRSFTIFSVPFVLWLNLSAFSARFCNSLCHRQFVMLFTECSALQNNKERILSSCLHDLNLCNFHLFGMLKDKLYGNNPWTDGDVNSKGM